MTLTTFHIFAALWVQLVGAAGILRNSERDLTRLPTFTSKPRTFILTDILNEPDDSMSMVRYLLYSNELDTQGLVATTSQTLRNETHPDAITAIIEAYGEVVDHLNGHVNPEAKFQAPQELMKLVTSGPKVYGRIALNQSLSDGSRLLVQRLEESSEPLHVSVWGGANTLAQALQHIHDTKTEVEAARLRSRLRVYSISDQDDTGAWMRVQWPDVFYIVNAHAFLEYSAGTWSGINNADNGATNQTKVEDEWLDPNIRVGPLGAVYPEIIYGMEGDTPSFLWLIQNGLSNSERPDWGGWGGRYRRITPVEGLNEYGTSMDTAVAVNGEDYRSNYATVWRWRDAYQDDFAARMHWTVATSFEDAAHPPVISINGSTGLKPLLLTITANETVTLDATETYDNDHPEDASRLEYEWYFYEEPTNIPLINLPDDTVAIRSLSPPAGSNGTLPINSARFRGAAVGPRVMITTNIPDLARGAEFHVILQVNNNKGKHPIRRYKRVVITFC